MQKRRVLTAAIMTASLIGCEQAKQTPRATAADNSYVFERGFPSGDTAQKTYDDADVNTAINAYKFFYPTVSIVATWKGNAAAGLTTNNQFLILEGSPKQVVFTPNSDTPYEGANIDLTNGPMVVELPPGALMCVVNDLNQRYVMDMGIPGPDAGKGGKHLILPPGYKDKIPTGYFTGTPTTNRVLLLVRAIPPGGDVQAAIAMLKSVKLYPLNNPSAASQVTWFDVGENHIDFTPVPWEKNLDYWKQLAEVINSEPAYEGYRMEYGLLASLGIAKGRSFNPDSRMQGILVEAAQIANDQMRVQSFADRRPDRLAWPDRKWEWATLRPENGTFDTSTYKDLEARTKWFYQAQIESPAMFRRTAAAGSLYWLGTRDGTGAFVDGAKTYKLSVPQPVPAKLFWSITIYSPDTRSEIVTDQNKAALRSLFELKGRGRAQARSIFILALPPLPAMKGSGSRPIPARAGSRTSAFTGLKKLHSMERGSLATLKN